MNRTNNRQQPLSLDGQVDEERVRRALGLTSAVTPHQQRPEQARQRHRFVSDGSVPVVMLNRGDGEAGGLKERLAALEAALETERASHAATRRALSEAQAAAQALRTRLGHAELAHSETLASEREARRTAEDALAALRAERIEAAEPVRAAPDPAPKPERAPRRPRAVKEQAPVRWWTPSYRAKRSG